MSTRWKRWLTSRVAGALVGVFAGGLTVLLVEAAGHALFGIGDPNDLSTVTGPMFASVLFAWVVGSGVGGAVATAWSRAISLVPGIVVGFILLGGAVATMVAIPHPRWMVVAAVVLMPAAAVVAARGRLTGSSS